MQTLRRGRYGILIYDLYPEILVASQVISEGSLINRIWRAMQRRALRRADFVVSIGEALCESVQMQATRDGAKPAIEITQIPTWVDTTWIRPIERADNAFAQEHGITKEHFVVQYSGNIGSTFDVESYLAAVKALRDVAELRFLLIGTGARFEELQNAAGEQGLDNLTVLPFQPESILPEVMGTPDIHLVALAPQAAAHAVPSKLFYAMASGRPVIGITEPDSGLAHLIDSHDCGLLAGHGDQDALVACIQRYHEDPSLRSQHGATGRDVAVRLYDRVPNVARWCELMERCLPDTHPPSE